eukprot:s473_g28.t2
MTAGGSWGCFSGPWQLCWPKKRCRAPRLDAPDAQQLPDLDEACAEVQRSDGRALLRRRVQVTAKLLPVASKIAWQQFTGSDTAVANTRRLRMVLEALGPAFVKLGQAAACREDILSEAVAKELRKLCDQVAPFDHSEAQRLIPVGTAGLQPPAPDPSGHCRTSSASSRSQWALPDSIRERQIPVGTAGLQPSAPDPSGHCRTSSASSRCQWALPDFNRELQIPVGTAGLKNVEHHPQVGADATARYNCYTSAGSLPPPGAKIIDLWSNPHKIWCCENMGVACATSSTTQMPTTWIMVPVPDFKEGVKGVPAIAGADGMVPFAATFHCHVGIPTGWSQEQQDFCCKHVNIGCKMAVPPEPNCELLQGLDDAAVEEEVMSKNLYWMRLCISRSWWRAARLLVLKAKTRAPGTFELLDTEVRLRTNDVKLEADQLMAFVEETSREHGRQGLDEVPCALQWAQNSTTVFLGVKYASRWSAPGAIEVADVGVNITEAGVIKGYVVDLPLFAPIVPDSSSWSSASVGRATATLQKQTPEKWPKLTGAKSKHPEERWSDELSRFASDRREKKKAPSPSEAPTASLGASASLGESKRIQISWRKKLQRWWKKLPKPLRKVAPWLLLGVGSFLTGYAIFILCTRDEKPSEPSCKLDEELSATNDPMHWLPSKREWCCAKHQTGCLQVPAVLGMAGAAACEGDPVAWDEAQKTYCCTTTGLGCTTAPPASSELYDCTIGFATWQDDWSTSHQEWCCTHHGRACA